eukprot:TRINITY_DN64297_c0_g1_i1.p1 TRINITY_DN64297_c0_g1~~TRINITY_DN64297_c0_g1_i1.p1  ORF type:complete len:244 (+),score=31.52 TRINITY_DN64297_c0_g1_i1:28-732(+)
MTSALFCVRTSPERQLSMREVLPCFTENLPQDTLVECFAGLHAPALAAMGCASPRMATAVFEDELVWWRVTCSVTLCGGLPQSVALLRELHDNGRPLGPASYIRQLARQVIEQKRREEARAALERRRLLEQRFQRLYLQAHAEHPHAPHPPPFGWCCGFMHSFDEFDLRGDYSPPWPPVPEPPTFRVRERARSSSSSSDNSVVGTVTPPRPANPGGRGSFSGFCGFDTAGILLF